MVAISAGVPVLLWGSPGTGKTSAVLALAERSGWQCEVVIGSIREPTDFGGLPVVVGGEVRLAPPSWARRLLAAGHGLLFLDELTTAPPAVQAAMLRIVLERAAGDVALPPAVRVVAAANPAEQAADGWELAAPLANRLVHVEWPADGRYVADAFWLLHQVGHLLRAHAARFPGRHEHGDRGPLRVRTPLQRRSNGAGDAEIDDDLVADGIPVPERAVTPASLGAPDGLTAEEYWDLLDGGSATGPAYDCGGGCDGQPRPWGCGWPGLGGAACDRRRRDTARRIREHARKRGDVPAGWLRWSDGILEPTVDWRRQLAAQIRRGAADAAGRVDFSYRRPSRRQAAVAEVVLPSLRQPLPRVAVVIDTSGSMSDGMLGQERGSVSGCSRLVTQTDARETRAS